MTKGKMLFAAAAFVMTLGTAAQADMITTLYAANNSGSFGGAVYFDVTTAGSPLVITGYDTNTAETVSFGWQVYITDPGVSYSGLEGDITQWNLVATGTGTGAGLNAASPVTLDNTFLLGANTTYGMALVIGPEAGHDYTNGDGSNQFYSNADVSLSLGSATNIPFGGSPFSPRVWNGTMYYDVPAPGALALLGLVGICGTRRRR